MRKVIRFAARKQKRAHTFIYQILGVSIFLFMLSTLMFQVNVEASSHREAPLIANDPLADNTDVYAFRSPDEPNTVTLIANYIPAELPQGGPNYYSFGENIRYEIHVDNDVSTPGDDVTYRATFTKVNEDPSTFFTTRLGAENGKTTYTLERSMDGGNTWQTIVADGTVPPPNIGPRSIESAVGLGAPSYESLIQGAIEMATTGERVFCGPVDDPFFVDLGGIFDLGNSPRAVGNPRDGLARYNCHTIAIQVPIETLQKDGLPVSASTNILDGDFIIGVWASASRPAIQTLSNDFSGAAPTVSGQWMQVSRLGMPLTNEAVIPIGSKDEWNSLTPYNENTDHYEFFYNPELALYMDDDAFGGAVPAFCPLRIQKNSLAGFPPVGADFPGFDFSNGADGASILIGTPFVDGTALAPAPAGFGELLLIPGKPRSVDLWPIFHTGAPNLPPYQLATGKGGVPVAAGKPFINNFLPNGGDMLRLNMAVPPTPRNDANFSSLGLVQAAVIGLVVPPFNTTANLEFLPNMDGFPNGRRLEDDVTRIELQAVAGVVLAAIGLWYDDFDINNSPSPVTQDLLNVLGYTTGVEQNDAPFRSSFPYMAAPWSGKEGNVPVPVPSQQTEACLYVSNTANPGVSVYRPTLANIIGTDRFVDSQAADGNGIFVDEIGNRLIQLSRATSTITIYENATSVSGGAAPLTSFTDLAIVSGREIAYDPDKRVLYVADNSANAIFVYDEPHTLSGNVSADRVIDLNGLVPWGITFDRVHQRLYVAQDLSTNFLAFNNPHTLNGTPTPDHQISINGAVRTHGITYAPETDDLIVTDVAAANAGIDPAFAEDGAIFIIEDITDVLANNPLSVTPNRTIAGPATLLGNPVDVDVDARPSKRLIYIAEKTKGGSILAYSLDDSGDVTPQVAVRYPAVPEDIYLRKGAANADAGLYVSNTATPGIGIYEPALNTWAFPERQINTNQADGNGVVVDYENNRLYQLSRATSTIKVYDAADAVKGNAAPIAEFSDPAIVSGREIALDINNQVLYVADNVANAVFAYNNPHTLNGTVAADRTLNLNGTPWGISYDPVGDRLFVAKDLTNMFQVYNVPLGLDGNVTPDNEVAINGATRTHGITYSAETDVLVVTEIGAAAGGAFNEDGAIYVFNNISASLQTNPTNINADATIAGLNTQLGNPVDVDIDDRIFGSYIYVAEKTEGGRLLIFSATDNGDVAPILASRYAVPEDIFLDKFKVKNPIIQVNSSVYQELPVNDPQPVNSGLYVSNTANPGASVYNPALANIAGPDRFVDSGAADGNGIIVDERTDRLIQLSRATATITIYASASTVTDGATPLTQFTDPAIVSGREIAYDENREILYVADNSANAIFVYDQPHLLVGAVSANRVINLNGVPWGISFDPVGDRLFVAKDLTTMFQVYNNPHTLDGVTAPDSEIAITGAVRTHGITYSADSDILIVTDVADAASGTDGAIYVIENASALINSGATTTAATRTIAGPATLLGNPVDVDLDDRTASPLIYIAEKTKGGYVLVFDLNDTGDVAPKVSKAYSSIPEDIYLRKGASATHSGLYVSNTAIAGIGIFEPAFTSWAFPARQVNTNQADGNGIVVDHVNDRFYQLSRATSTVKVYNPASTADGNEAPFITFTDAGIVSGREMALDIGRQILYIADHDAGQSSIRVYDNPSTLSGNVTADRVISLNGRPWGISFDPMGDRLFVAKDLTDAFQVYNNPHTLNGVTAPDVEISIAGGVRTHGITYAPDSDVLIVTEIGAAAGGAFNQDGGLYVMRNASALVAAAPATVTPDMTIAGLNTLLGNPVDVDFDDRAFGEFTYVAEKTNGGKLLIFNGDDNGDVRPTLAVRYAVPEDIFLDKFSVVNP